MERESLIGMWDVYAGPSHSELLVQPDGGYYHSFWGGAQSHWGRWSLEQRDGHSLVVLRLTGAQPMIVAGPFGPQPAQWPAMEQWAVTAAQPDQIGFYGGLMVRRVLPVQPGAPAAMPPQFSAELPPSAAQAAPQMPPQAAPQISPQAAAPTPPSLSELAPYSAPPPPPTPDVHSAEVLKQWQDAQLEVYKQQQAANLAASQAVQQANLDAFSMNHAMQVNQFSAMQGATFATQKAVHAGVQSFLETLK